MSQTVKIIIPLVESAPIVVESDGFVGPTCASATAAVEAALGTVVSNEIKSEYYEKDHEAVVTTFR